MPGLVPSPRHLCRRRLLLASLTGSERRGDLIHGPQPRAVASSSRRMSSAARIPDWEREEGKLRQRRPASCRRPVISADVVSCSHPRLGARGGETPSKTPGLVPLPRHLGGRRLLHASLTGSERRGDFFHGAQPPAFAPSSRRALFAARIPDWEREEGRLRPWRLASFPASSL